MRKPAGEEADSEVGAPLEAVVVEAVVAEKAGLALGATMAPKRVVSSI